MSLIGSLDEVELVEVLRLMAAGKKTGVLTVTGSTHEAVLRFQKGALVHAATGRRLQGEAAVFDLFGWKEGQLTFVPEESPVLANVNKPMDALIDEGLREGETLHRMNEVIPSDRVVFQLGPGPADDGPTCTLRPAAWRVLRLVDGLRDVREVIETSKVPRAEVLRVLFDLADGGFLERVEPVRSMRLKSEGGLFGGKDLGYLDERYQVEWKRLLRFGHGVLRVEVRTLNGRSAMLQVAFRPKLARDLHLPRNLLAELGAHDGEEAQVRPVA
jgi:hypothetical protein